MSESMTTVDFGNDQPQNLFGMQLRRIQQEGDIVLYEKGSNLFPYICEIMEKKGRDVLPSPISDEKLAVYPAEAKDDLIEAFARIQNEGWRYLDTRKFAGYICCKTPKKLTFKPRLTRACRLVRHDGFIFIPCFGEPAAISRVHYALNLWKKKYAIASGMGRPIEKEPILWAKEEPPVGYTIFMAVDDGDERFALLENIIGGERELLVKEKPFLYDGFSMVNLLECPELRNFSFSPSALREKPDTPFTQFVSRSEMQVYRFACILTLAGIDYALVFRRCGSPILFVKAENIKAAEEAVKANQLSWMVKEKTPEP